MLVDENVRLGAILLAILLESHGRFVGLLYSFSGRAVNDYGGMLVERTRGGILSATP